MKAKGGFLLLCLSLVFAGCGSSDGDDGGCTSNNDCPTGQYCGGNGACTFDCKTNDDCPNGTCNSIGKCVADTPPKKCDSSNCNGCCAGDVCKSGTEKGACGKGGAACTACGGTDTCDSGVCTAPTCGPGNCTGCCSGATCKPGTSDSACGKGGEGCQACYSGAASCVNQTCTYDPCGPSNCTGCCKNNQCLAGTSTISCGKGGMACQVCTTGEACENGACVTAQCGPGTCAGCCLGNSCLPGDQVSACGGLGGPCTTCKTGEVCAKATIEYSCGPCVSHQECDANAVCVQGACSPAYNRMYRVKIVSAKINQYDYSTVATGEAWDVPGGMPDPFVQLTVGTAVSKTTTKQDTLTPAWGESFDVFIKQGELFRFDVSDEDLVVNDGIGAFEWKQGLAILTLKAGGQTIKPNPADPKFGVQELVFTIVPLSGTTPTSNSGQTCDQSTPCSSTQDDCLLLTGWTKGMCLAKCAKQGDTCPTADPTKYLSTCALANQTQTQWNCLYICEVQGQTYQCPDPATQDCVASTTPGIKTCKPK